MADFDWKKLVGALAPTLGTALGGPLVGSAISVLSNVLLGHPEGSQDDVSAAVLQGLSPEAVVQLRQADNDFKARMQEMQIDLAKLNQATELAYVQDTQNARDPRTGTTRRSTSWAFACSSRSRPSWASWCTAVSCCSPER
jgi:hypothetical protein